MRSVRRIRYRCYDFILQTKGVLAEATSLRRTRPRSQNHVADILNCGPRHRFVAYSSDKKQRTIVSNCVQGLSRDIMAEAMLRTDKAGYKNVLTVHDEIVAETPKDFGSLQEYNTLMCQIPDWAEGFPITAGGWTGLRYRKA